jgi:hypothetical protein
MKRIENNNMLAERNIEISGAPDVAIEIPHAPSRTQMGQITTLSHRFIRSNLPQKTTNAATMARSTIYQVAGGAA